MPSLGLIYIISATPALPVVPPQRPRRIMALYFEFGLILVAGANLNVVISQSVEANCSSADRWWDWVSTLQVPSGPILTSRRYLTRWARALVMLLGF